MRYWQVIAGKLSVAGTKWRFLLGGSARSKEAATTRRYKNCDPRVGRGEHLFAEIVSDQKQLRGLSETHGSTQRVAQNRAAPLRIGDNSLLQSSALSISGD